MNEDLKNLAELRREVTEKFDSLERLIKKNEASSISILTDINFALSKIDEAISKLRDRIG